MRVPRLHLVTDDAVLSRAGFQERAAALLAAGGAALAFHLRGPGTPGRTLLELVRSLREPARASGSLLVVNDRVDVALSAGADGAHLGARSLPLADARRIFGAQGCLGVSVHTAEEGAEAAAGGADWIFAGTIYETASHPGRPGLGPAFAGRVAEVAAGVPVLAIGGVTPGRVGEVLAAGAWGVALIRGVWDAADPTDALRRYLVGFETQDGNRGTQA
ncbi:MAG TPA: thiamine phosphate synthase [Longimicrobiales bacterium]|nr:thiamine phosphate synthase [Longimicrobiales bacterium]